MNFLLRTRTLLKFLICILSILIYIAFALILNLLLFIFPGVRLRTISHLNCVLAKLLRIILGINISVEGKEFIPKNRNFFILSNHLTYLDGIVLGSLFPVLFVSKKEVKSWPLFGQMVSLAATIFIDRKRKNKTLFYVNQIAKTINNKVNVLIFPEGTSTDGTSLRPFQTIFFSPAIITKTSILPIAIKYIKIENDQLTENNKDMVYWYGTMPFFSHLWKFMSLKSAAVLIEINPAIDSTMFNEDSPGRKALSNACYEAISKSLANS